MEIILIIFIFLLAIFSIIDVKNKAIPSVLLTATLFALLFIRFENIQYVMILSILGILIWEFAEGNNMSFGIADIKVMAMLGFFIPSMQSMMTVLILFAVGQVIYIFGVRKFTNMKEIPFIPLFFALFIGGLAGGIWA